MFVSMVQSVLQSKSYYFSYTLDLTHTLQRLQNTSPEFRQMSLFERLSRYALVLLHGFVDVKQCQINNQQFTFAVISRRCVYRAGCRFHTRGIDRQGHAANFIETEQILQYGDTLCAFVQTRGSIPLFWGQSPNLRWQPWPKLYSSVSHSEGFRSHIDPQILNYGRQILVNLLNHKGREKEVNETFENVVLNSGVQEVKWTSFDFHSECKAGWDGLNRLLEKLKPDLLSFEYFETRNDGQATKFQSGVFRTNCMDCLDRTNVVQSMLARFSLEQQLKSLRIIDSDDIIAQHKNFDTIFKDVWADNGDYCSFQYAGTGALKADFTRTGLRTKWGMMKDLYNALIRYYRNNFADGYRQDSIDLFLGNFVCDEKSVQILRRDRDWRFVAVPLLFIFAFSMWVLCLILSTERFFTLFWFFCGTILLSTIFYYGEEFVNKPRLKSD